MRTRTVPSRPSTAVPTSFTTRSRAVSTELVFPVSRLVSVVQPLLCEVFSKSEGHYFLHYLESCVRFAHQAVVFQPVFVKWRLFQQRANNGLFSWWGKSACSRDVLTIRVTTGVSSARESFKSLGGRGSSSHVLLLAVMAFRISSSVAGLNSVTSVWQRLTLGVTWSESRGIIIFCRSSEVCSERRTQIRHIRPPPVSQSREEGAADIPARDLTELKMVLVSAVSRLSRKKSIFAAAIKSVEWSRASTYILHCALDLDRLQLDSSLRRLALAMWNSALYQ